MDARQDGAGLVGDQPGLAQFGQALANEAKRRLDRRYDWIPKRYVELGTGEHDRPCPADQSCAYNSNLGHRPASLLGRVLPVIFD